MRTNLWTGPFLLAVWQFAPVQTEVDANGRYRLSLGFGGGQFENRTLACDGSVKSATQVPYGEAGGSVDMWPAQWVRLSLFGGVLNGGPDYNGPYGGGLIAAEWQHFGVGGGAAGISGSAGFSGPAWYLRLGDRDGAHLRSEWLSLNGAPGTTGLARFGIGINQGMKPGPRAFFGIGVRPYGDRAYSAGFFGDLGIPVSRQVDLDVRLAWRSSHRYADWGIGGGFSYYPGR